MRLAVPSALMLVALVAVMPARAQITAVVAATGHHGDQAPLQGWASNGGMLAILALSLACGGIGGYLGARTSVGGVIGAARGVVFAFAVTAIGLLISGLL